MKKENKKPLKKWLVVGPQLVILGAVASGCGGSQRAAG